MTRIIDGIEHPVFEESYTTEILVNEPTCPAAFQISITGTYGTREVYRIFDYDFKKIISLIDHLLLKHKTVDTDMIIDCKEISIARRESLLQLSSML